MDSLMVKELKVEAYARDVVFSFKRKFVRPIRLNDKTTRGSIKSFSDKSRRKANHVLHNSADSFVGGAKIELTYPSEYPHDGSIVKNHLYKFLKFLRYKELNNYFWVIEFQERGAPHFHILIDKHIDKDVVAEKWYKIVNSGDEKHLRAGTRVAGIRSIRQAMYLSGYFTKAQQKAVPESYLKVGRFWGRSTNLLKPIVIVFKDASHKLKALTRTARRLRKAMLRELGIKWRWHGAGFRIWNGSSYLNALGFVSI